jgi:hypothetical protein
MNRSLVARNTIHFITLLGLAACAAPTDTDESADSTEESVTTSCAIETCALSTRVLQAKSFTARPPARYRADIVIDGVGFDPTPREVRRATSRPYTWAGERRVLLGGSAAGDAAIVADDFVLVEALDASTGAALGALTIGAPYRVTLGGKAVANEPATKAVDIGRILPKNKAFRLRLTGLDAGGKASVSDVFLSTGPALPPPPPPGPSACTTDVDCGGGSAMCFVDRCVTVSNETRTIDNLTQGVTIAYRADGSLFAAYESYTLWDRVAYQMFQGTWGAALTGEGGGGPLQSSWVIDRAPGLEPQLARAMRESPGSGLGFGSSGGPVLPPKANIRAFGVGRDAAGKAFAAIGASLKDARGVDLYRLYFATKAPTAWSWSTTEVVADLDFVAPRDIVVHVRADGGADVVVATEHGDMAIYRRTNPIDPWAVTPLLPGSPARAVITAAHGAPGTTHLVAQAIDFVSDRSYGDYTVTYIELGDAGAVRSIPLGTHTVQYHVPFPDLDVDGEGNVWIQKRPRATFDRPAVVRVDRAGKVAERSLGLVPTGSWPSSHLAVSKTGELALTHVADNKTVGLRRFTPKR